MSFANFSLATAYATIISMLNTQLTAVGKLFKDQTTGDYTDQIRYNSSLDKLEYWTGSAWAALPMTGTASGTAATLATARTIGGVSFNGSTSINLPGVNTAGNQSTSGNAATATVLQTARTIGGESFNGSTNIDLPGVNTAGNQNTSGNAATATTASGLTTSADLSALTQFVKSFGASGYQKLPSGLILQWGSLAAPVGTTVGTFPVSFPTSCLQVLLSQQDSSRTTASGFYLRSKTASGFSFYNNASTQLAVYFAIGN